MPLPAKLVLDAQNDSADEIRLLELRSHYDDLKNHPAWQHFTGRLLEMKDNMERGILIGERDRFGNDLSDKMRASYGTMLQILAIPGQITILQKASEVATMGASFDPGD